MSQDQNPIFEFEKNGLEVERPYLGADASCRPISTESVVLTVEIAAKELQ